MPSNSKPSSARSPNPSAVTSRTRSGTRSPPFAGPTASSTSAASASESKSADGSPPSLVAPSPSPQGVCKVPKIRHSEAAAEESRDLETEDSSSLRSSERHEGGVSTCTATLHRPWPSPLGEGQGGGNCLESPTGYNPNTRSCGRSSGKDRILAKNFGAVLISALSRDVRTLADGDLRLRVKGETGVG